MFLSTILSVVLFYFNKFLFLVTSVKVSLLQQHVELSLDQSSILSGICINILPDNRSYSSSYKLNKHTSIIIKMCRDPSLITSANLLNIHSIYYQPMRDFHFSFQNNRLQLKGPFVYSTHTITLIIIPMDLCNTIFISFQINPLGNHYSYYYTLCYIRL